MNTTFSTARALARFFVTLFVLVGLLPATGYAQSAEAIAADAARLVQALNMPKTS